ncbi:MAG: NADH-quinone oxidoreductase subunit C [Candidatus Rokubacteria bacterium]|nr:NADH-quinone oxidoreductase subunit C [Candidatus Rokubacteria bacterium]
MSLAPAAAADLIRQTFGIEPRVEDRLVTVPLAREQWPDFGRFARETLGCLYLNFLSAIDWKAEGIEVICRVENLATGVAVMMRTKLGAGELRCPTLVDVWAGANWMEREAFDMFGLTFDGHPDLRRLLLGDNWELGPPLRKDFVDSGHVPYR